MLKFLFRIRALSCGSRIGLSVSVLKTGLVFVFFLQYWFERFDRFDRFDRWLVAGRSCVEGAFSVVFSSLAQPSWKLSSVQPWSSSALVQLIQPWFSSALVQFIQPWFSSFSVGSVFFFVFLFSCVYFSGLFKNGLSFVVRFCFPSFSDHLLRFCWFFSYLVHPFDDRFLFLIWYICVYYYIIYRDSYLFKSFLYCFVFSFVRLSFLAFFFLV